LNFLVGVGVEWGRDGVLVRGGWFWELGCGGGEFLGVFGGSERSGRLRRRGVAAIDRRCVAIGHEVAACLPAAGTLMDCARI
jgi:hypothetical protein